MTISPTILGCAGTRLSAEERAFFTRANPLGFILFARNCETPGQIRALVAELRSAVGRADAPVLIDQEGGRVARLKPPQWRAAAPAGRFGELAARNPHAAIEAVRLNSYLIARELAALGIDVDCAPVLDLRFPGAHEVIGDRAFGAAPQGVAELGRAACEGFLAGGVLPVIKHVPGHGRAMVDSHHELPIVTAARAELEATDFEPFRLLADMPWAMTAHVRYTAIDPSLPATLSPVVIREVIRGHIGFDGLLLCDDLSMRALKGDLGQLARQALAAGCDIALHCNGNMKEMTAVVAAAGVLSADAERRFRRGRALLERSAGTAIAADEARLAELMRA
ncbi:MAG: beta-N-acetylhexosaminidase [Pseudomonadota bacterium]